MVEGGKENFEKYDMEVEEQKIRGEVSIFFYIIYNIRKNRIRK
jgi:hypothetical protein